MQTTVIQTVCSYLSLLTCIMGLVTAGGNLASKNGAVAEPSVLNLPIPDKEHLRIIADLDVTPRLAPSDPSDADAYRVRSARRLSQAEYDLALADASKVIELTPNDPRGHYSRSVAYAGMGNHELVIRDATRAIQLAPNLAAAYFIRARAYDSLGKFNKAIADLDRAVELDPEVVIYHMSRGDCFWRRHKYDQARADYDAVLQLRPSSPYALERRGAVRIERGDFDGGLADLQTAIHLDPDDPAAGFDAGGEVSADSAALEHGEAQLRRMLKDRPAMAQHGKAASPLYRSAARLFAGDGPDQRIFWDPANPDPGTDAMCSPRGADSPARIHLRKVYGNGLHKGRAIPFEELWRSAVFELFNVRNGERFSRICELAAQGKLSKHEYVSRYIDCEAQAAEKARAFYVHVFLPWAKEHHVSTHPQSWFIGWRSGPNDNLLRGRFAGTRYWRHYELGYDVLTMYSLISRNKFRDVLKLAAQIRREELGQNQNAVVGQYVCFALHGLLTNGDYQDVIDLAAKQTTRRQTDDEKRVISSCRGYCLFQLKRPAEAVDAYREAIRLAPADADAYWGRATAYYACFDWEHAMADCNEVVRLRPAQPNSYRLRASVHRRMGHRGRAQADRITAGLLSETERSTE